ncbi:MAG: type II toxin-antitoxin system Phd/YefM family antitoxin [Phascolarctobacterium sp.]
MIQIKPVSDLRNKYTEIEKLVNEGNPVYLTKNGYGTMVVMSIEAYSNLIEGVEDALDLADASAAASEKRLSHKEVFGKLRAMING